MKKKDIKDLHTKTVDELQKSLQDLKNDVAQLSIDASIGKIKNVNEARQKKKDIARIYTVMTAKAQESTLLEEENVKKTSKKETIKEEKNG